MFLAELRDKSRSQEVWSEVELFRNTSLLIVAEQGNFPFSFDGSLEFLGYWMAIREDRVTRSDHHSVK